MKQQACGEKEKKTELTPDFKLWNGKNSKK